jgi:signal peptidase I
MSSPVSFGRAVTSGHFRDREYLFHVPPIEIADWQSEPYRQPTVSGGDHVMMEGISYLLHKPRRGDVVVFKTDGIESLLQGQMYIKRMAGEPGDHLQISDGKLFINDERVSLSNQEGEIIYRFPPFSERYMAFTNVTIPAGYLYVLGDNSTNSSDSRSWGQAL